MQRTIDFGCYRDKVYAGWMGKSIGGTIGARMENHKTRMHLTRGELWPDTIVPNDDMDIQIVWLEALQERGIWLSSDDLAELWQDRCWYNFCEYGVFLNNFQRGIHPPLSGHWNNRFFFESEGCPIRSEIWGLICPGNPQLAAEYARLDAQLDHGGASVLCEMFLSAAAAAAFFERDLDRVIDAGLAVLPPDSVVHRMVAETRAICLAHPRFEDAWRLLVRRFGDRDASKAIMNQAIVVMALTLGRGDFAETMRLACNSGWDTDCTAATAGALLGIMKGADVFPPEWVERMGKNLACGIEVKHRRASFEQLTEDTARVGIEVTSQRSPGVTIHGAPVVPMRAKPNPGLAVNVAYPEGPCLRSGRHTPLRLELTNVAGKPLRGAWRVAVPEQVTCSAAGGDIHLPPRGQTSVELLVAPKAGPVWDQNLFTLHFENADGGTLEYRFGIGGARLWRVYGPYWDMWDTSASTTCPYNHDGVFKFPAGGDSWNHYARLDHPYLDEARLLREDIPEELPEEIQAGEDYLDGGQIMGFRGQACMYLVRELVSREPRQVRFHVTCNAPVVVWFDGREMARRPTGREISPQDGVTGVVDVGPEARRLVIKVARQVDALSLCVLTARADNTERTRGISMFADTLGDVPMCKGTHASA